MSQPTALLLMGAPKSGLSALAGCLYHLGVSMGTSLRHSSGPQGYPLFEHAEVITAHDMLLQDLGSSWEDLSPLPPNWLDTSAAQKATARIEQVIRTDFSESSLWAVKDHRLCRLLPLWLQILGNLGIQVLPVLLVRHPDEVIQSLEQKKNISSEAGALLWFFSNQWALQYAETKKPFIVTYDALLANPVQVLEQLAKDLGIAWPRPLSRQVSPILDFLLQEHKHFFVRPQSDMPDDNPYTWLYHQLKNQAQHPSLDNSLNCIPTLAAPENSAGTLMWRLLNDLLNLMDRYKSQSGRQIVQGQLSAPADSMAEPMTGLACIDLSVEREGKSQACQNVAQKMIPTGQWLRAAFDLSSIPVSQGMRLFLALSQFQGLLAVSFFRLSNLATGKAVWSCSAETEFSGLDSISAALRIPSQDSLQYLVLSNRLECVLSVPKNLPDAPLELECWMKLEPGLDHHLGQLQAQVDQVDTLQNEVAALKAQLGDSSRRWEQAASALSSLVRTNQTLIDKISAQTGHTPPSKTGQVQRNE